ncbi:MAG TPA: hypothetical protein VMY59_06385 [Candidatus Thermoplasmatota archaeon]|nr:hypothetical protein [Candidatus Thermoplasmatota archaeon]
MIYQQKNKRGMYNTQILLLPIIDVLFVKKPIPIKSSEENTLDFHLDMIKKIDALLQKHDTETPIDEPTPMKTASTVPQQVPIEVRPSLERRPGHIEPEFPHMQEISFPKSGILPEEFKTDSSLDIEPEFKFITSFDSIENTQHIRPQHHERIEIIDLSKFIIDDITSHLDQPITIADFHTQQKLQIKKQAKDHMQHFTIQDPQLLNQKESQEVFLSAGKQNEEIEKKKQIYYHTNSENKKNNFKQGYFPENFEERLQMLQKKLQQEQKQENSQKQHEKEKQQKQESNGNLKKQLEKEEQQRRKLEQKRIKQLEKVEQKKHKLEEKIKIQVEREKEKFLKHESQKVESKEKNLNEEKKEPKEKEPPVSLAFTKKQLREQRGLERLAARQAIFEERLKIKKEKRLLKEQKKHLELKRSDSIEKYTPEPMELDSDIKKILQITDELLGELPEEIINRFMRSDEYDLYENIINKYKIR